MDMQELVQSVSSSTGVGPDSVKKLLDAAFDTIGRKMMGNKPVKIDDFGTFKRKEGKDGGKARVVFRPWLSDAEKESKKAKKAEKKEQKAGSTTPPATA